MSREKRIKKIIGSVEDFLREEPHELADVTAALMVLSCHAAIYSIDNEEFIINEFRKTLESVRSLKDRGMLQ